MASMREWFVSPLLLLAVACGPAPDSEWHHFGSADGELVQLTPDTTERSFRAHLCRAAPDDVEIDVRLGAWATSSEPVDLEAIITTPDGEHLERITADGRTRLDVEGLDPLLDAEASCNEGVGIRFVLPGEAAEVEIEWALHFGFRADEELVGSQVELVDDP